MNANPESTMASNKRKCLPFDTKLQLIEEVEKGTKSKAEICREHGIAQSSLSTILKDKDKIRAAINQGTRQLKKQRMSTFPDVDKALLIWFKQARTKDVPISGPILIEKGEQLAQELGYMDCKLSGGWLDRFKIRHGIVFKTMSGEAASAKDIDSSAWEETLQSILTDYSPRDIFNADETGLFYKCLPNKSLTFQGQTCSGQKAPKERVSLLCATNMDGSEKLPLLMIGKFSQPRCFKGINTLPVTYRHNKKAWMTGSLFEEWVRKQDRRFLLQGRSVALVLDNCSAHPQVINDLRAITMFFLPPNTTSCLQPCDQGIIKNFKTIYRKRVLQKFISSFDGTGSTDTHMKLSLLDASVMSAASWNEVTPATIQNCFRHAGFVSKNAEEEMKEREEQPPTPDETNEVSNLFERFARMTDMTPQISLQDFISVDETTETSEEMSLADIASSVQHTEPEEETADDEDVAVPKVTSRMALQALEQVQAFFMQQKESGTSTKALQLSLSLENCVQEIVHEAKTQSTIDSFFSRVQQQK